MSFDLESFGNCNIEDILNSLASSQNLLFHGSRHDFSGNIMPGKNGKIYATDKGHIAILKAILSNKGLKSPGLSYPLFDNNQNGFEVRIYGIQKNTIGKEGYVYLLNDKTGFENYPEGSWQYVNKTGKSAPFTEKIKVTLNDFIYPIYDIDNRRFVS